MIEKFLQIYSNLPKELLIFIISILPISELRGAIPIGISLLNLGILKTFIISIIGNFSFVIPFLWFLKNLHNYFMKYNWYSKFFDLWFKRVKPKTKNIEKYEYIGLTIFVSIPLPMTGAWSGCVASHMLGLDFWKSVLSIFIGIVFAGIIVTISTVGINVFLNIFL